MSRRKPCMWNGVRYDSITEAANANEITIPGMLKRIAKGYSNDKELGNKTNSSSIPCEWEGEKYPNINSAATANEINYSTLRIWVLAGYKCYQDVKNRCFWGGHWYYSHIEIAQFEGVSPHTIAAWIKSGYQSRGDVPKYRRSLTINGCVYDSITTAANKLGFVKQLVHQKVEQYGNDLLYFPNGNRPERRANQRWFSNDD